MNNFFLVHKIEYQKTKCKILDHHWIDRPDGTGRKAVFNYFSGHTRKFWEGVFKKTEAEFGFNEIESKKFFAENSKFSKTQIMRAFSGKIPMPMYMHFELLDSSGFDLNGNIKVKPFSSYVERDRLILTRNIFPTMTINTKIGDWYDIHLEIHNGHGLLNRTMLRRLIMRMFRYYFHETEQEGSTKTYKRMPYSEQRIKLYLNALYTNGSLKIGYRYKDYDFSTKDKNLK